MAETLTVEQATLGYLEVKKTRSRGYQNDVAQTLRQVSRVVGHIQMRNLTETHIAKVFDTWNTDNKPSTFNKKYGHVQQWLSFAHLRRQTRRHPTELMSGVETRRVVSRRRIYLSARQLLRVLETSKHPRDRAYFAIAMNTSLRAGEIASLKVGDLDLEGGWLYVLRHKTGTRDVFPITSDLEAEMRTWLTYYGARINLDTPEAAGYYLCPGKAAPILSRPDGGYHHERDVVLRPHTMICSPHLILQSLLEAAGFSTLELDYEGLHTIRRSVARLLYEHLLTQGEARDEALSIVQATLGHATQEITLKYIGVERFREMRNRALRNRPLLTAMIGDTDNVRRLHG